MRIRIRVARQVPKGDALDWQANVGPTPYLAEHLHAHASLGVSGVSVVPGQDDPMSIATIDALAEIGAITA